MPFKAIYRGRITCCIFYFFESKIVTSKQYRRCQDEHLYKGGDKGTTSLVHTKNVSKSDDRIQLVGTIDELTSHLGPG